ncbi:MAG: 8-amino-7-oxononanoate synthase [Nitrospiraceae bacterium]|nr:8-amino-7-oxononanoate synthase [Nitrospiraceae bacterium]
MFEREIERLRAAGLFREPSDRASLQGAVIAVGGRLLVNFASNDYLGLAAHEALIGASQQASIDFGSGGGAARLLSGGTGLHAALERASASFTGAPSALLFNSGYHANAGAIPALAAEGDLILSDELNHASIIDGCRLSKAETLIYRHADAAHLRQLLEAAGKKAKRQKLIVTESVFSMDGDIAPLPALRELAGDHGAVLYVDEAHAIGVLGGGRGGLHHFGLSAGQGEGGPAIVQMGTFSKALGSYGAFVAADPGTIEWLRNKARTFIFSTALPPGPAGAALAALKLLEDDAGRALVTRLWENRELFFDGVKKAGFETGPTGTPIVPVFFDGVGEALGASGRLLEAGFHAPAIRPPTVKRPRLRLQVSAAHSRDNLDRLLSALMKIRK